MKQYVDPKSSSQHSSNPVFSMVPNMLNERVIQMRPHFRSYPWGGRGLERVVGKKSPTDGLWAESWEIVDCGENQSIVGEGHFEEWSLRELMEHYSSELVGWGATSATKFPLTLKYRSCENGDWDFQSTKSKELLQAPFIPATLRRNANLNLPDNISDPSYPMLELDVSNAKAWYVIDSLAGAKVHVGLKTDSTRDSVRQALAHGELGSLLQTFEPQRGDCFLIPAGMVHALGTGLVVVEIQPVNGSTLRLCDSNRLCDDGGASIHSNESAFETIDIELNLLPMPNPRPKSNGFARSLVDCDQFKISEIHASCDLRQDDSYAILTVVEGNVILDPGPDEIRLKFGDSAIMPASNNCIELEIEAPSKLLVVFPPFPLL